MQRISDAAWRLLVVCVGLAVIVFVASTLPTTYAQLPQSRIIQRQVQQLKSQGNASDVIPVIIQLQNTTSFEMGMLSQAQKSAQMQAVAQQSNAFVQRNQAILLNVKGMTKTTPIVFAQVMRGNVEQLGYDKQIASITLDEPMPPLLDESIDMINSRSAVTSGYDGSGATVAVVDTGVAKNHIFLSGQVIAEACFSSTLTFGSISSTSLCPGGVSATTVTDSGLPCPLNLVGCSHGTHVAGIIAGKRQNPAMMTTWNDSTGVSHTSEMYGVAPGAKIIAIKVFSRFPASFCGGSMDCVRSWTSDQIAALDWLYTNASTPGWGTLASVNMSLGGGVYSTTCDTNAIKIPIDLLRSIGVATVIASGNNGSTTGVTSPACVSSAIAVGASASDKQGYIPDTVASFSNAPAANQNLPNANGDRLLDLMAPGMGIYSSYANLTNQFIRLSGTSMATPHVAGAWAVLKGLHANASVSDVLTWLSTTGVAIDANKDAAVQVMVPRINVNAAVTLALDPNTVATQTANVEATSIARQTATMQAAPTQTALALITQTVGGISTATSAARLTATAQIRLTQTDVARQTQTMVAQNTQTMAAVRTSTVAAQRTATTQWQMTATDIAVQTRTAVAAITRTAAVGATQTVDVQHQTATAVMAITRTAASELTQTAYAVRTATTQWQRTATAEQRQTDTAIYYLTRTAVVAVTQTDIADRSATAITGRTQTAEIVNPTNTAVMALTRTAASEMTQTANAVRTATTEWQRTITAVARQTDVAIFYMTRTAVIAITQTDIADRSATAIIGRTQTAEIVNPTNTAVMALTRTAASELTQTAYAVRTATMAAIRTSTAEVNQTNTAIANITRTQVRALTQTAISAQYTAISNARTATTSAMNATNTVVATQRTATAMVQQTATSEARQTNTAVANITRTAGVAMTQTTAVERTAMAIAARTASRVAWNANSTATAQTAGAVRTQTAAILRTTPVPFGNNQQLPTPQRIR